MESDTVHVVENAAFRLDAGELLKSLRLDDSSPFVEDVVGLAKEACAIARPKGVYRLSTVSHEDERTVRIDGITFTSRVLRVNLDGLFRVFPFIATCGDELAQWTAAMDDPMQRFWADTVMEKALRAGIEAVARHLNATYKPGRRAIMNPGSLEDWPLAEQQRLFDLLGDPKQSIGVSLSESFLMWPIKSVSGIWFETEKDYENCQLCPRDLCPNRRAPYDPHLLMEDYELHA
jgi:hypothetical protein